MERMVGGSQPMISSLTLTDFQCHGSFLLELGPGITTLTGDSDKGKSAVLRGLKWLCFNRPSGDGFVRHGQKHCMVRVEVEGREIIRSLGKKNLYTLDGVAFQAFGKEVPGEIAKLLNVDPINFQGQIDAPLWFTLSAGQVAKEINSIVNLEVIDATLGNLAVEGKRARGLADLLGKRVQEAEQVVMSLDWLEEAEEQWQKIEAEKKAAEELQKKKAELEELLSEGQKLEEEQGRCKKALPFALEALEAAGRWLGVKEKAGGLEALLGAVEGEEETLRCTAGELGRAKEKLAEAMKGKCPVCHKPMGRG